MKLDFTKNKPVRLFIGYLITTCSVSLQANDNDSFLDITYSDKISGLPVVHSIENVTPGIFGGIVKLGDTNGDGYEDYAYSDSSYHSPGNHHGKVVIVSGKDNSELISISAPLSTAVSTPGYLGGNIEFTGDLNNDGHMDIASSLEHSGDYPPKGSILIYSGLNGDLILSLEVTDNNEFIGDHFKSIGDINGDGTPDLIASVTVNLKPNIYSNSLRIYSGANGTILRGHPCSNNSFPCAVESLGDTNKDGYSDYVISDLLSSPTGSVKLFSGKSGVILQEFQKSGQDTLHAFGANIANVGDINSDGVNDLAISSPSHVDQNGASIGAVHIYSGSNGIHIKSYFSPGPDIDAFGGDIFVVGDLNFDGYQELVIGGVKSDFFSNIHQNWYFVLDGVSGHNFYWNNFDIDLFSNNFVYLGDLDKNGTHEFAIDNRNDLTLFTLDWDADQNGMPQMWEYTYGFGHPFYQGPPESELDLDNDGLINRLEFKYRTFPDNSDSDNDGFDDLVDDYPLDPTKYLFEPVEMLNDLFSRPDNNNLGLLWSEENTSTTNLSVSNQSLFFESTSDATHSPSATAQFDRAESGELYAQWQMNWTRDGNEGLYKLYMQLGDADQFSQGTVDGVATNLVWTKVNGNHESLAYVKGGAINDLNRQVSGTATIELIVNLDLSVYKVIVDGDVLIKDAPFDDANVTDINAIRFYTDGVNHLNFNHRSFDNIYVEVTPASKQSLIEAPTPKGIGEHWLLEEKGGIIDTNGNTLIFSQTLDLTNSPIASHTFLAEPSGDLKASWEFDWTRTGNEGIYSVYMQLGDTSRMNTFNMGEGVAVNLVWTNLGGSHQMLALETTSGITALSTISGPTHIEIVASSAFGHFSILVDGNTVATDIPYFDAAQLDNIRFFTDGVNEKNFSGRAIRDISIQ